MKITECIHGVKNIDSRGCWNCLIDENEKLKIDCVQKDKVLKYVDEHCIGSNDFKFTDKEVTMVHEAISSNSEYYERFKKELKNIKAVAKWEELELCDPSGTWYDVAQKALKDNEILMEAIEAELSDDTKRPRTAEAYAKEFLGCAESWEKTCRMALDKKDKALTELAKFQNELKEMRQEKPVQPPQAPERPDEANFIKEANALYFPRVYRYFYLVRDKLKKYLRQ